MDEASEPFTSTFLNFVKQCIPSKTVTIREDDKPWYDSEIRSFSRKRDKQKRNIKSDMRSFKSNENIHKKEGGSYYVVSANKASSVTQ